MKSELFVSFDRVGETFRGKRVAIVCSGPSCLNHDAGFIDSHDVVVRVNNFLTGPRQGRRADVFYSYFGGAIRRTVAELKQAGVALCVSKVPNAKPIDSEWHEKRGKTKAVDFRYIYRARQHWWFCPTFVPSPEHFLRSFHLLGGRVPTTGFAAILDVLECAPASVYLTGFDGFTSGIHNVNEKWRRGNPDDPIGHRPDLELDWLAGPGQAHPLRCDPALQRIIDNRRKVAA